MEIMSPASLWKDFDRKLLPLDVTRLSSRVSGGYRVTGIYFSALKTEDGCVRAYATLHTPLHAPNAPVIIYFNDIGKSIQEHSTMMVAMDDYAFLRIDYAGCKDDRERHTLYPKSLNRLNYFEFPKAVDEIPSDIKKSGRYVWAVMAMRAITLIETEFPNIESIGMIGVGLGGCPVTKACCRENAISAAMTIYSSGYIPETGENPIEYTAYKAALDCESYGPYVSVPLLTQITSNESNGSMDYMNYVFEAMTNENCRLSIVERSNRGISAKQRKNCRFWFDFHIKGIGVMPKVPRLKARSSEGRLYLEGEIDQSAAIFSVELFVSQGMENSAYRNWSGRKIERISESGYLAAVPVYDAKSPLYAFVNVKYDKGPSLSCSQLIIFPEKLSVKHEEIKPSRLIYDSDMCLDDWIVLNDNGTGDDVKLSMEPGPFDIMGVSSATGSISTFKISEKIYKSFRDSALQLLVYSPVLQDAVFSVAIKGVEGGFVEYSCARRLSPADNWASITLSATDFKSAGGTLESFENVATFEINSKSGRVLVSSMLWV